MRRPHPYLDEHGEGWPDNDARFLGFSVAVTALARVLRPDLLHLNDWHTAAAVAGLGDVPPSVLTVHNLAYQGRTGPEWVERLDRGRSLRARRTAQPARGRDRPRRRGRRRQPHLSG